jgi:hypothetical protein
LQPLRNTHCNDGTLEEQEGGRGFAITKTEDHKEEMRPKRDEPMLLQQEDEIRRVWEIQPAAI